MSNNPFGATAPALGYLYQCRYGLRLLLERARSHPEVELSIERFDDIAFEEGGESKEQLQTKHHLGRAGNLTDASIDLWKTLRVWSDGVAKGRIRLSNALLFLVTTATAPDGSAASKLRPAPLVQQGNSEGNGRDEVAALETLLGVARTSESQENASAYKVFRALPTHKQKELLSAIRVLDKQPNIVDVLPSIRELLAYACRSEHLDYLIEQVEGWWFGAVVRHLAGVSEEDRTLRGYELHTKIADIQESLRRDNLPTDLCFVPLDQPPDPKADRRFFARQLRIVGCSDNVISTAICDHYRCFRQRSEWVRKELMLVDELGRYERRLVDEWQREFDIMAEDLGEGADGDAERNAGRDLYRWSQRQQIHVRPDCTEPVIARGSFHILAEDQRVGWHPRFSELLAGEDGGTKGEKEECNDALAGTTI